MDEKQKLKGTSDTVSRINTLEEGYKAKSKYILLEVEEILTMGHIFFQPKGENI